MTYSDDLDCKVYIAADAPRAELAAALARALAGAVDGPFRDTVRTPDALLDVVANDEFDERQQRDFPDGFLHFRYAIEVYPRADAPHEAVRQLVARLLEYLWGRGIPAVAACDYEDELPFGGGYKSLAVPWVEQSVTGTRA
ncbi:MAG TPA: hypothetical protein VFL91_00805 [Thermomicrobiales bacterium]|nr:hypothetical protein [Thermomicrobiales bacterium]